MKRKSGLALVTALFAAGVLCVNRLPASAEETVPETAMQEEIVQPKADLSGTCGENVTWAYDSGSKTLTISGTGPMEDYDYNSLNAPSWIGYGIGEEMKEVVVEEGVTYIGNEAFYADTNLTAVTLPESLIGIGDDAFYLCGRIEKITLPSHITTIGAFAFYNCWTLKELNIPSSVTSIGVGAFCNCTGLEQVALPAGLTAIKDMTFSGCTRLKWIELPPAIKSIGVQAFDDCSKLEEAVLSDNVTWIGSRAFMGCRNLKEFSVPGGLSGIAAETFSGCDRLAEVTFPNSITVIEYDAFRGCANLPKVEIPASVVQIKGGAFRECNSLQEIHFMGGAPKISTERKSDSRILSPQEVFSWVTADVYYTDDPSWNADTMKDYGGKLTWMRRLYIIAEEAGIEVTDKIYVIGSGTDASIKCSGAAEDFVSLVIDGKSVDPSYYKVESGSTALTILSAFLDQLAVGNHEVTLNYTYGSVDTVLTIIDRQEDTEKPGNITKRADPTKPVDNSGQTSAAGAEKQQNEVRKSPQTGEFQTEEFWSVITTIAVMACIGGAGVLIWRRKKTSL